MKKHWLALGCLAVVLAAGALWLKGWSDAGTSAPSPASKTLNVEGCTILLDPGHGGFDPGKVAGDVMEKDLNLTLSLELAEVLRARGFQVALTRAADTDFRAGESIREWKRADLGYRVEQVRATGATVFLSIHMNSFDANTQGAQVFYNGDIGKTLAASLQDGIKRAADPKNHRQVQAADYYVLAENEVPAALIEAGFLSCPEDRARLLDEDYRAALCRGILSGLCSYLGAAAAA